MLLLTIPFIANAQSSQNRQKQSKVTKVTPIMARKIKYTYETNSRISWLIYDAYKSVGIVGRRGVAVEMEKMLTNPNGAKYIINYIFDLYGSGDYSFLTFTDTFGFTVNEFDIALQIYDEYEKEQRAKREARKRQEALEKIERERQEALAKAERIRKETNEEINLLKKWNSDGVDFFTNLSDKRIISPKITVNLNTIVNKYDSLPIYPNEGAKKISMEIASDRKISHIITDEILNNVVDETVLFVEESAKFKFEHIDTIIPISCNYSIDIYGRYNHIGNIQSKIKFNKKENLWEINILDEPGFFREVDVKAYNQLYTNLRYNQKISTSPKDAIAWSIAKAINTNESIQALLMKGKHILNIHVYNHSVEYNEDEVYGQPYINIFQIDSMSIK